MDFRRIPFQFTTTDPLKRQEELQRRFGLPANKGNMYVDFANPGAMGTRSDTNSASNSPRLQHRVPIFVEGQSEPVKPTVDAQNVDSGRRPHVRVIPIEIEGEDNTSKRHRWHSGSSELLKERVDGTSIPVENVKHPVQGPSPQSPKAPRVCNIPIKIEGSDHVIRPKSPVKTQKVKTPETPKHTGVKLNGCSASKVAKVNEKKESKSNEKKESPEQVTLKKIQNIEEKLKDYHADVEKFSGTNKEKQYRYLDEMLTRCMLELDEIDTMGLDTIRLARKAAVKKVQASIDLLESKIIKEESKQDQVSKESMEVESLANQSSENFEDTDMKTESVETEETKKSEETITSETNMDNQDGIETGSANIEMTDVLSEQINEKVENISIMETEDAVLKPDEKGGKEPVANIDSSTNKTIVTDEKMNVEVMEPVQITEIEAGADIVVSESEPVVEEPLSDSKDEKAIEMDLDSCNCESDLKLDETSSVQICEVENDSVSDLNKLEAGTSERSDQNLKMDVTETSDIPTETVSITDAQTAVDANVTTVPEQSAVSIDSNKDSNIIKS
ncbi:BAG domain-containing protein Samui-like [Argiope bruennichi]|uniref:BAG domain-containing protein Samui-like n=1 Tax=Argiope bruennichi TaxID=94029 RepID=UPI0024942BC3|nr:BAG domain-containing protein Samui-like [Argiope bruennichi]